MADSRWFAAFLMVGAVAGCSGSDPVVTDSADDTEVATSSQALSVIPGADVTWVQVGNPSLASRIASAGGALYALNDDARLYRGNGADNGWYYAGWPSEAIDIAGDGNATNRLYALNKPGANWWNRAAFYNTSNGSDSGWVYLAAPSDVARIGRGLDGMFGLTLYGFLSGMWFFKENMQSGTSEFDSGMTRSGSAIVETKAIVVYGTVKLLVNGAWVAAPIQPPGQDAAVVRDITLANAQTIWALTEGMGSYPRRLFKTVMKETDCYDGIDNDRDLAADGSDWDCISNPI